MPAAPWTWTIDERIVSDLNEGHRLQRVVLSQLEREGWPEVDMFAVRLALEEAVVNAIKHGNNHDSDKNVHFICKIADDRLWVSIADEGPGFDPEDVPDCTELENLDQPSGRGIKLMQSFMTKVKYCGNGACVEMEKTRSDKC